MVTELGKRQRSARTSQSSQSSQPSQPSQVPTHAEIRRALDRLLSNKRFANAPMKRRFLQLICKAYLDGRAEDLNEYMIGCEVFGRNNSYNPALDPIVRVGAHELRKKLENYYKNDGKNDDILLEVPIGSYIPVFTRRTQPPETADPPKNDLPKNDLPEPIPFDGSNKHRAVLYRVGAVFLILSIVILVYFNWELRKQIKEEARPERVADVYSGIWGGLFKEASPALLVLSNSPVYRFGNTADLLSGPHTALTTAESKVMEETFVRERLVIRNWAPPRLLLSYDEHTSVGETIGLFRIASLFNKMGKNVVLKQSRTVSAEDLKNHDSILLGSGWVNEWLESVPVRKCFTSGAGAAIINHNLPPGQRQKYDAKYDKETGRLIEDYAVITIKPGISERKTVIVLAGMHSAGTQAAAEYITDEQYLADLNRRLLELSDTIPRYFQVLLKVSVDNGTPTNISVVKVREFN
jgi:hypothetical protein